MTFLIRKVFFLFVVLKGGEIADKSVFPGCIGWKKCETIYVKLAVLAGKTGQADDTDKHLAVILPHDAI